MNNIKFSHDYPKLWGQKTAELIAVRIIDAQAISINKQLIEYDTKYLVRESPPLYGYYQLPKIGKLIQLIFIGNFDIPFCTLRRYIPDKYEFYKGKIGSVFNVVVGNNDEY